MCFITELLSIFIYLISSEKSNPPLSIYTFLGSFEENNIPIFHALFQKLCIFIFIRISYSQ